MHQFSGKANNAVSTLSGIFLASSTQLTIQAGEQNKMPQNFPFRLTLHYSGNTVATSSEIVYATGYVGGLSNNTYVVVRGREGTAAQDWDPTQRAVLVENLFTKGDTDEYEAFMVTHNHDGVDSAALAPGVVGYLMANVDFAPIAPAGNFPLTTSFQDLPGLIADVTVLNTTRAVRIDVDIDVQNDIPGFTGGDVQIQITEDGVGIRNTCVGIRTGGLHYGAVMYKVSRPAAGPREYKARALILNGAGTYVLVGSMTVSFV